MEKEINKIIMGEEYPFDYDDRYFLQTAEMAMKGNVIRGLIELITNCDDSYDRLEKSGLKVNGKIKISIERKRKDKNSIIKILDNAEGMTIDEMLNKIKRIGGITSGFLETRGRGLMGRGSKECVVFGQLRYQSIKNEAYSEIRLKKPAIFIPICGNKRITESERVTTQIDKGNGTLVTLETEPRFAIPLHESLLRDLPKYYSLRDIASDPHRELTLIDSSSSKTKELSYTYPNGEIVFDDKIDILGYANAEAHLIIKKSQNRIICDVTSPYWEGGILVKSTRAIHGITSLSKKIENNPYFEHYFGKVICPYIDDLVYEYEKIEKQRGVHSEKNPYRIIDPLRSEGLVRSHPFTKSLYDGIKQHVELLLKNDEDGEKQKTIEIENKKTRDRFKKLANEAGKFIKDNTEGIDIEDEKYITSSEIESGGMIIIPGGLKITVNQEARSYIYIRPSSDQKEKHVVIINDSVLIRLDSEIITLVDRGDGIYMGIISVLGLKPGSVNIELRWGNVSGYLKVVITAKEEVLSDIKEFQFEKDNYTVKEGKKKDIRIFAQWPGFIHGRVKLKISMYDNTPHCRLLTENIILNYDRKLKETLGIELAVGVVKILGLKAGGPIVLSTILQNKKISTKIRVTPERELGKNLEIKIVDEDLGDIRAGLFEDLIKINGRHKNIKRYLGPAPGFEDQDSIHFRLLMAELIADTVARRILELNAQKNIDEYRDMDVTSFYRKHREYMNKFLEIAHRIQIPDIEVMNNKNLIKR